MNYIIVLAFIGIFWAMMAAINKIFNLQRYNLDFQGISILWRTEKLNDFIDSLSQKARPFWNVYAWAGILFSSAGIVFVLYYMVRTAYKIVTQPQTSTAGAQLLIPGVTVPFWYSLAGLIVVVFAHELSHGIVARFEKMKLKSVGLALFIALPVAFVEPDEEELKGAKRSSRLKLYASGSFANFIVWVCASLLLVAFVAPAFQAAFAEDGVRVIGVMAGMPAENRLHEGMVIRGINGAPLKSMDEFSSLLSRFAPGDTIEINTDRGDFTLTLARNPEDSSKGYIGITIEQSFLEKEGSGAEFIVVVYNCLWWIALLNIGIGIMNLLPITFMLDGGKMVKEYLEMILPARTANYVTTAVGIFCVLLLIINVLPGLLR